LKVPENFLFYLSAHQDCTERLLAGANGLVAEELEVSPDSELVLLRRMVANVQGEVHRMKAFVRLKSLGPLVLYGYLKPRHRIGAHVCDHFARRNPKVIVVLGNGSESWISLCSDDKILRDHRGGIAETLEQLRSNLACADEGSDAKRIWRIYYDSQYCPERKNMAAFRRRMPRRDLEAAGLRPVQSKNGVTLEDFFDKG
jgi:probable DNA metabolism protein